MSWSTSRRTACSPSTWRCGLQMYRRTQMAVLTAAVLTAAAAAAVAPATMAVTPAWCPDHSWTGAPSRCASAAQSTCSAEAHAAPVTMVMRRAWMCSMLRCQQRRHADRSTAPGCMQHVAMGCFQQHFSVECAQGLRPLNQLLNCARRMPPPSLPCSNTTCCCCEQVQDLRPLSVRRPASDSQQQPALATRPQRPDGFSDVAETPKQCESPLSQKLLNAMCEMPPCMEPASNGIGAACYGKQCCLPLRRPALHA